MLDDVTPQPLQYDEALARYTDQLLDQNPSDGRVPEAEDPDMQGLQSTVELVWAVLGQEEPDRALRERVHQNLLVEWHDTEAARGSTPFWKGWLPQAARGSSGVVRGGVMLAAAVSVLLLIVGAGLAAAPSAGSEVSGAAAGSGSVALIAVGAGGLLIILVWLLKNNRG